MNGKALFRSRISPNRNADRAVGESQDVSLAGQTVVVKLLDLKEQSDSLRNAVRLAEAKVEVAGKAATLVSANYHLPIVVRNVQIDCLITRGYTRNSTKTTL